MSSPASRGRLAVVGVGPGALDQLTRAAEAELAAAELLVGYRAYLDRVPATLAPGHREAYSLGEESARARRAVEAAAEGARVVLGSSGDAGIYGMASLAIDAAVRLGPLAPDLVIVPGVTAASAAAALVGAPLAVDFACLSLSDLLLPRGELMARVEGLAAVDITLALYNPASRTRREPWEAALAALARHRPASTPVAVVRRAYREGQSIAITELARLPEAEIDMETVVIVGGSRTRREGPWLYTLRDEAAR